MFSVVYFKGLIILEFIMENIHMMVFKEVRQVEVQEQCVQLSLLLTRLEAQVLVAEEANWFALGLSS